jgi:hypothetical protein
MRASWSREVRSGDRGRCRQSMEPRNRGSCGVPTRSEHAEGHTVGAVRVRCRRTWRGRRPLAGTAPCCAEPGRPCLWPGAGEPGPHGEPKGYARDGRVQGVGLLQSTEEAVAQGVPSGTGGEGGGKGAGQGERGSAEQGPDTAPGCPVTGARPRTAGSGRCWHVMSRGRSPVRECRTPGSVRGVPGNWHPYRDLPWREEGRHGERTFKWFH